MDLELLNNTEEIIEKVEIYSLNIKLIYKSSNIYLGIKNRYLWDKSINKRIWKGKDTFNTSTEIILNKLSTFKKEYLLHKPEKVIINVTLKINNSVGLYKNILIISELDLTKSWNKMRL